jgi:LysR family cys regulon transcriptional activator
VVIPNTHPLLEKNKISLEDLASYPLITYDQGFTGRSHIDDAFAEKNISPDIVLTAMDSDVIQQYVSLGLGVGIVASMAAEDNLKSGLTAVTAEHLFSPNTTRVAVRSGAFLRQYMIEFILRLAPSLKSEKFFRLSR